MVLDIKILMVLDIKILMVLDTDSFLNSSLISRLLPPG